MVVHASWGRENSELGGIWNWGQPLRSEIPSVEAKDNLRCNTNPDNNLM